MGPQRTRGGFGAGADNSQPHQHQTHAADQQARPLRGGVTTSPHGALAPCNRECTLHLPESLPASSCEECAE